MLMIINVFISISGSTNTVNYPMASDNTNCELLP